MDHDISEFLNVAYMHWKCNKIICKFCCESKRDMLLGFIVYAISLCVLLDFFMFSLNGKRPEDPQKLH
jgi:hypothetical protein